MEYIILVLGVFFILFTFIDMILFCIISLKRKGIRKWYDYLPGGGIARFIRWIK